MSFEIFVTAHRLGRPATSDQRFSATQNFTSQKGFERIQTVSSKLSWTGTAIGYGTLLFNSFKTKDIKDNTIIYTFQPPRPLPQAKQYYPEYLIRESLQEKWTPIPHEKRCVLEANLYLDLKGTLAVRNGTYYLVLSKETFTRLREMVFLMGFDEPVEPLIPVILPHETLKIPPMELGKEFSFALKRVLKVAPPDKDIELAIIAAIASPELTALRERYYLSPKLDGRDFSLTLGIKKSIPPKKEEPSFFKVNVAMQFA